MKLIKKAIGARSKRMAKLLHVLRNKNLDRYTDPEIPETEFTSSRSNYFGPYRANSAIQDIFLTAQELGLNVGKGSQKQQLSRAISKLKQTAGHPNTEYSKKFIAAYPINNAAKISVPVGAVNPASHAELADSILKSKDVDVEHLGWSPSLTTNLTLFNKPLGSLAEGVGIRGNPEIKLKENVITGKKQYVTPAAAPLDTMLSFSKSINYPYFEGVSKLLKRIEEGRPVNWDSLIPGHIRQAVDYVRHVSGERDRGKLPELKENFIHQLKDVENTNRNYLSLSSPIGLSNEVKSRLDAAIKEKIFDYIAKDTLKKNKNVDSPFDKANILGQAVESHPLYRRFARKLENYADELIADTPKGTLLGRLLGLPSQIEEDLQFYKLLSSGRHGKEKFIRYSDLQPRKNILRTLVNVNSPVMTPTLTATVKNDKIPVEYPSASDIAKNMLEHIKLTENAPSMHFSKHPTVNLQYLHTAKLGLADPYSSIHSLPYLAEYKESDLIKRMGGLRAKPVYSAGVAMPTISNSSIADMAGIVSNTMNNSFYTRGSPQPVISNENLAVYPWYEIAYPQAIFNSAVINPLIDRLYKVLPGKQIRLQEVYKQK